MQDKSITILILIIEANHAKKYKNTHQLTRKKEKSLVKFKSPQEVHNTLSLMGESKEYICSQC